MKKITCFLLLFLLPIGSIFSQLVINEVMVKPGLDASSSLYQSLKMCSSSTSGSEYIELYNADPCNSIDISCYLIGFNVFTSQSHGTFRFPAGSVIPPLGFLSIGGPNSGATINLFNYCSTPNLNTGSDRWYLENGDGYIILYDPSGTVVDAVYWTFSAGQANKWGTDPDISNAPTLIAAGLGCPVVTSLPGPSSIPIGNASYAGQGPNTGTVLERTTDGGANWASNAAPSINNCNGICAISSAFERNATVVQPTCGNSNGSISFAPSPSGTYFFTWPFPSTGNMSSATGLAPGTYNINITNLAGCSIDTLITLTDIPCGNVCDPNGNLVIYSNYDGGILTINVDQNIPNLKVGICTYEPIQVAFTGPFVGNITQVIYAGMNSNQNNNNCGLGNFTTSISGVPAGLVTISPPMNPPLVGYTPAHGNGSGPWGGGMLGVAGLCDTTVNAGGGNTPDEVVYYFLNATSGTLLFHQTQYACWVNETINITAGGNCCILPPISNPCPTLTVATSSQTNVACFGQSTGTATVSASGGNGPYTYTWTPGNLNGASQSALAAGTYTINITDNNNCPGSGTVTINQPTSGLTVSASATSTNCGQSTGSATATPSGGTGTYSYVWSPSGGSGASASNLAAGTYTVTVTDQNGCQATTNATVSSIGGPIITLVSSAPVTCFGDNDGTATVSASGGSGALTYTWSPSGGNSATANGLSAGTYTVTVTDASSCTGSLTVTIGGPTQIAVVEMITNASCGSNNGSISTNVSGGAGTYTYNWTPNGETTPSITGLSQGAYSVTVSDANGCSITENYNVLIIGTLPVIATPVSSTINEGDSVQLNVTGATTYSWTPTSGLSCTNCPNPIAFPSSTTTYIVTGTDATGCAGSDTVIVFVVPIIEPCGELFVPTVLAPDGMGPVENKKVCIYGGCISELTFAIFNRWGEKVFESTNTDLSECWDGTYKGQPMNAAVFTYKLIVTLNNGEQIKESGNITLIR